VMYIYIYKAYAVISSKIAVKFIGATGTVMCCSGMSLARTQFHLS